MMPVTRLALVAIALLTLAGCGASSEDELHQWMAEQKSQAVRRHGADLG